MIDVLATKAHYLDHLVPVWQALPMRLRGNIFTTAMDRAATLGVPARHASLFRVRSGGPVIVASSQDHRFAARRQQIVMFHGAGQRYEGYRSRVFHPDSIGLELHPSQIGCPKLDRWIGHKPSNDRPVVAFSWHWEQRTISEMTGSWAFWREAVVALSDEVDILAHAHPRDVPVAQGWWEKRGIPFARTFDEVLERADLFVADNTSALFEFAALDRPVVVLNAPWFRRDVHHGGRFWEWADVGVQCDAPSDLRGAIQTALDDRPAQRRRRMEIAHRIYNHLDGTATKAAVDAIVSWVDTQQRAAA